MDNMAIIVRNVTKKFGNVTVLDNVSLQVKKGTICGIIGRNGIRQNRFIQMYLWTASD